MTVFKDHDAFTQHPKNAEIGQCVEDNLQLLLALDTGDRLSHIELFVSLTDIADWPAFRGAIRLSFRHAAAGEGDAAIERCRVLDDLLKAFTPQADVSQVISIGSQIAEFADLPDDSKVFMGSIGMILMALATLRELGSRDVAVAELITDIDSRVAKFLTEHGGRFDPRLN